MFLRPKSYFIVLRDLRTTGQLMLAPFARRRWNWRCGARLVSHWYVETTIAGTLKLLFGQLNAGNSLGPVYSKFFLRKFRHHGVCGTKTVRQKLFHSACFGPNECNDRLAELRYAACINRTSSEVSFLAMQWASLSSVHAYEKKFWKIVIMFKGSLIDLRFERWFIPRSVFQYDTFVGSRGGPTYLSSSCQTSLVAQRQMALLRKCHEIWYISQYIYIYLPA